MSTGRPLGQGAPVPRVRNQSHRARQPQGLSVSQCFGGSAPHPCLWSVAHGSSKESSSLGNSANGVVWRGRYTRPSWALCLRLGLLTLGLRESLTDRCRAGDDFKSPHAHVPAEARQGDARLSCFNAHALHRCPCHGLLNATPPHPPHTYFCAFCWPLGGVEWPPAQGRRAGRWQRAPRRCSVCRISIHQACLTALWAMSSTVTRRQHAFLKGAFKQKHL